MCSIFLWRGNLDAQNTARVAWATVTKPKEEGGLGVKDLLLWNKACCLRLVWLLFFRPESVWVSLLSSCTFAMVKAVGSGLIIGVLLESFRTTW